MFGLSFEFPQVSFIQFIVTLVGGMIAIIGMGIYLGVIGYFGKEMKPYMDAKLRHFSIFQIYSLGNSLRLEFAKQEKGGGFRLLKKVGKQKNLMRINKRFIAFAALITVGITAVGIIAIIMGGANFSYVLLFVGLFIVVGTTLGVYVAPRFLSSRRAAADLRSKTENETDALIIPPSTYNVEGVTTVLAFEIYPELHEDLLAGVRTLKEKEYTTISELKEAITSGAINKTDILFGDYTYDKFLKLYNAAAEKLSFSITVDDILKFLEKHSSQRFSESLSTRITNTEVKKKRDNWAKKYGFYIVLIWAVGLLLILAYKVICK